MKTLWKLVDGLENRYIVSNTGKIKNIETGHHVKPYFKKNRHGDNTIRIVRLMLMDGRKIAYSLPLLVAKHFVLNPRQNTKYIHRDNNKLNCNAWNLRWIDDDVAFYLQNKSSKFTDGRPKSYGKVEDCIELIESKKKDEFDELLLKFYRTNDERFLWDIYLKMQYLLSWFCKNGGIAIEDRHDIILDSFMYFIDRCQRFVVGNNAKASVLQCLKYHLKTNYSKPTFVTSAEHIEDINYMNSINN